MSTREEPESGLFLDRLEHYRESTAGAYDTQHNSNGPSFSFYSDNPADFTVTPGVNVQRRDGLGTADAVDHDVGNEEPEIEIVYDLQKQLVDGPGDPDDASADAVVRNSDERVPNTHHVRAREDRAASDPDDPANASGCRIYTVGVGAHPDAEFEFDPENGEPVAVTLTYSCEKVRQYEIFQPDGEALEIASSSPNDTSQTLTIEDDAGNSEDVSLTGTTTVTTTKADWTSIRGCELDAECEGDVTVSLSSSGDTLATLRGSGYYGPGDETLEGDLGPQALGGGSLASAIGGSYEYFNGASVTRGGSPLEYDLNRLTLTADNDFSTTTRHDSTRMRVNEGNRGATLESDVVGWGAAARYHDEALGINGEDIVITLTSTKFTLGSAVPRDPGDTERTGDDSAVEYSVTFEPSGDNGVTVAQS